MLPLQLHLPENSVPGECLVLPNDIPLPSPLPDGPQDPSRPNTSTTSSAGGRGFPQTDPSRGLSFFSDPTALGTTLCWGILPLHAATCVFILPAGVSLGQGACLTPLIHPWDLALSSHKSRHGNLNHSSYSVKRKKLTYSKLCKYLLSIHCVAISTIGMLIIFLNPAMAFRGQY